MCEWVKKKQWVAKSVSDVLFWARESFRDEKQRKSGREGKLGEDVLMLQFSIIVVTLFQAQVNFEQVPVKTSVKLTNYQLNFLLKRKQKFLDEV